MNAGSAQRIGSREFLEKVEQFQKKCASGKPLPSNEIKEFYETIVKGMQSSGKTNSRLEASTTTDPQLNKKILNALSDLKATIGKNKAVLESAAQSIPLNRFEVTLNELEHYVKEQEKQTMKVGRKDFNQLSTGP